MEDQLEALLAEQAHTQCTNNQLQVTSVNLERTRCSLRLEKKQIILLRRKVARFPGHLTHAVELATDKALAAVRVTTAFHLKEKGVITESARHMIRELVILNVPVNNISSVILVVAEAMGMDVNGSLHKRSVGRIVLEGLVAAKNQIVEEGSRADGITLSGDGTTHKGTNYESRNFYMNLDLSHVRRFLGVHSAPNHTSEQQLVGWQALIEDLYKTYNASPRGKHAACDERELPAKVTGMTSDHANDQKKLHDLVKKWKLTCDREIRGEKAKILLVGDEHLAAVLEAQSVQAIAELGGTQKWDAMSGAERTRWNKTILKRVSCKLGEEAFEALPDEEKRHTNLFVSGYCCMHKELNAVKGGNSCMAAAWTKLGLTPPVLLMNKDNTATTEAGTSGAQERAVEISEGGGVKATQLAGTLFKNKDDKKGYQDNLRIFFEASSAVGAPVRFPDTSNTQYQSHCEVAAELLVHLDLYIKFLDFSRDKKTKRNFNNMEVNVRRALHDVPTLTELCALVLYSQSISHPYLRQVRGHDVESDNHLDLGPLHSRLKSHIQHVIDNPSLLLAADASYKCGALDGKPWEHPEVFYAIHRLAPRLPALKDITVEFFSGALDTWGKFTTEFAQDGVISTLTSDEKQRAWMRTTNDDNEGALGSFRGSARRAPTMTVHQYNARTMTKINSTIPYMKTNFTPVDYAYSQAGAHIIDGSGLERKRKMEQAADDERVVAEKRRKDGEKQEKETVKQEKLQALKPIEQITELSSLTVVELDLYLDLHRQSDRSIPLKSKLPRKAAKLQALEDAIARGRHVESSSTTGEQVQGDGSLPEEAPGSERL
ncbi:hypothetical protein TRAPUB_2754 [Trametes pubescens]|uniref:Uncharacterized protein n=2 Tax=Trametes pubescens TaxID=154538 RepID=A0A1M2VFN2_TRAPU|nr:hypothetical protein TRAPUB_2769 [Trametes pubescens]OJT06380.1 hypothetical protein TRAPUB_2754 [Trametes pubescens]